VCVLACPPLLLPLPCSSCGRLTGTNHLIRRIVVSSGSVSTLAGTGGSQGGRTGRGQPHPLVGLMLWPWMQGAWSRSWVGRGVGGEGCDACPRLFARGPIRLTSSALAGGAGGLRQPPHPPHRCVLRLCVHSCGHGRKLRARGRARDNRVLNAPIGVAMDAGGVVALVVGEGRMCVSSLPRMPLPSLPLFLRFCAGRPRKQPYPPHRRVLRLRVHSAGTGGSTGRADGQGTVASFYGPIGVAMDAGAWSHSWWVERK